MINPNKIYKARAVITMIPQGLYMPYEVLTLKVNKRKGYNLKVKGYDLPKRFKQGDKVAIEFSYSIVGEQWMIRSIRKSPKQ